MSLGLGVGGVSILFKQTTNNCLCQGDRLTCCGNVHRTTLLKLAAIIPSSLFEYDATSLAHLFLGCFSHSSLQNLSRSRLSINAQSFSDLSFIFPSTLTAAKHPHSTTMANCRDGIGQVMSGAWFPADMTLNLCFIGLHNFVSHSLRVLQVPFGKIQVGCHVSFTEEWLLSSHSTTQI